MGQIPKQKATWRTLARNEVADLRPAIHCAWRSLKTHNATFLARCVKRHDIRKSYVASSHPPHPGPAARAALPPSALSIWIYLRAFRQKLGIH